MGKSQTNVRILYKKITDKKKILSANLVKNGKGRGYVCVYGIVCPSVCLFCMRFQLMKP